MSNVLCDGYVTGSDAVRDVDGAWYTVGVTCFDEPTLSTELSGDASIASP